MAKTKAISSTLASRSGNGSSMPKTGEPLYLSYSRNTASAPPPAGIDFGQKIEPAGRYMNVDNSFDLNSSKMAGWETGYIKFENPLVLEHESTGSNGWKRTLSEMYGGKTGKRLSDAVRRDGYDGIVTYESTGSYPGFNETVDLAGKKIDASEFRKRNGRK